MNVLPNYTVAVLATGEATFNPSLATFKAGLFDKEFAPSSADILLWDSIYDQEMSGQGYDAELSELFTTRGQNLSNPSLAQSYGDDKVILSADPIVFPCVTLTDIRWVVIHFGIIGLPQGAFAILGCHDLGANFSLNAQDLRVMCGADGFFVAQVG